MNKKILFILVSITLVLAGCKGESRIVSEGGFYISCPLQDDCLKNDTDHYNEDFDYINLAYDGKNEYFSLKFNHKILKNENLQTFKDNFEGASVGLTIEKEDGTNYHYQSDYILNDVKFISFENGILKGEIHFFINKLSKPAKNCPSVGGSMHFPEPPCMEDIEANIPYTITFNLAVPPTPPKIANFEECVAAGYDIMDSYPRQCNYEGEKFIEEVPAHDSEVTNNEKPCTKEFKPVCGDIEVQCITTPCDPIKTTFDNRCLAENEGAKNITEGACTDENPDPEGACLSFDGTWLSDYKECEGMSQEMCENLGGTYDACASACRRNPKAELCTMQCVQVCQF